MSAQNVIELGFNVEELEAEKKEVLDIFVDMFSQLQKYDGAKFNPLGNGGLGDLKKSITDGTAALNEYNQSAAKYNQVVTEQYQRQLQAKKGVDDMTLAVKAHKSNEDALAQTIAKSNALSSTTAENLAIEKEQLRQRNKELGDAAKYLTAETGSVGEAVAANARLTAERNKINATTEEGQQRIKELNDEINKNNEFIKQNVSQLEQQKINIGNYTGAVKILEGSLTDIAARMEQMANAGDVTSEAYQRLVLEQSLLQQQLNQQKEGFPTVTAELRSMKTALDALALAGYEETTAFKNLNNEFTTAKQKVNELHEGQKILTAESPAFAALAATARGIGGAYAVGAGAAALFADGNEKVEKELNKLVAVMTVLQGLEEAVKAVKDRGAIATALEEKAQKLLNIAKQVEVAIFGQATKAVEANTVAKVVNSEATDVMSDATKTNTAEVEANVGVMEASKIATEGATNAAKGFRTALIATGIGAVITAVIYGITKLVGAISDWISADERAEKAEKELADLMSEQLDNVNKLRDAYGEWGKERIQDLERIAESDRNAGKNQFIQLEDARKIAEAKRDLAKKEVQDQHITQQSLDELNAKRIDSYEIVAGYESQLAKAKADYARSNDSDDKDRVESLQKRVDIEKKNSENVNKIYESQSASYKASIESDNEVDQARINTVKAGVEQLARLTADAAQRRYELSKDKNDRVLNTDTSTEQQRLDALKGSYAAENALGQSRIAAIKLQLQQGSISEKDAADQIANIQTDLTIKYHKSLEDRSKLKISYAERDEKAQDQIFKDGNDSEIAIQEAITKDLNQELNSRLDALKLSLDRQTSNIAIEFDRQAALAKAHGGTQKELDAIETSRQNALVGLTAGTQKEIYDITLSWGDKKLKAIDELNKSQSNENDVAAGFNEELVKLNDSYLAGNISYDKYLKDRKKLGDEFTKESDQARIDDDTRKLQQLKKLVDNELALYLKEAQAKLESAKAGGDEKAIADAQAKVNALLDIQRKANDEQVTLDKKKNDDILQQTTDSAKQKLEIDARMAEQEQQLAQLSFELASSLVHASYENRINDLQTVMDQQDKATANEIQNIQQSTLSRQEQAQEVTILQAQQQSRDTQIKNQQRQEKIKEAEFDKKLAVAEIGWKTAQAIANDLKVGWPQSLGVIALDAAIGAAQAAIVLSKPVPTYAEGIGIPGRGEHPGGLAVVGEEYKPEVVKIPGRDPFIVDKPTLMDLTIGSKVIPFQTPEFLHELAVIGANTGLRMINSHSESNSQAWEVAQWQVEQWRRISAKNSNKIVNKINIKIESDGGMPDHFRKKIYRN